MIDRNDVDLRGHDLNLFVVFVALMREQSVSRAARALSMSQSAVSAALGRLRTAYDDQLFTRTQGGIVPTLRAKRMYGPVLDALTSLQVAVGGEQIFDPEHDRFEIRIGMSDDLEALLMPQLLTSVSPQCPGMSAFCLQTTRLHLAELLESGDADLGIVASSAWPSRFRSRVLFESRYLTVYDPRQLGRTTPLAVEEFLAVPHVMISYDATRGIVDSELEKLGARRFRVASTAHFAMAPLLLKRTPSVATVPSHVAHVFAEEFGLIAVEPPIALPSFHVSAVWHQTRNADPEVSWMVDTIEQLTRTLTSKRSSA